MKLDYGTQISKEPISLSIGVLNKPTLDRIQKLTFVRFELYEVYLKLTPEFYYKHINQDKTDAWEQLSEHDKESVTLYKLILEDSALQKMYVEILSFFFTEKVLYYDGLFVFSTFDTDNAEELTNDNIRGVIGEDSFYQVLSIIQQVCGIYSEEDEIPDDSEFKNALAKKMFEKIQKAEKEKKKNKKGDKNYTIPNIISSVAAKHPSINFTNIWDLTLYQLIDTFNRLQVDSVYYINSTRVSVWGDEKNSFDQTLWYKNTYDK